MPSKELVPLAYDRTVWNAFNGIKTEHHNSLLNAEQAHRINECFNVRVVTGVHGRNEDELRDDPLSMPYGKTYEAAKNAVDTLQPGDVLLIEGYGHSGEDMPGHKEIPGEGYPTDVEELLTVFEGIKREMLAHKAAELRKNRAVTTWTYAELIARSRGVDVIYADMDKFSSAAFNAAIAADVTKLLWAPNINIQQQSLVRSLHERREQTAVNTAKDWMLSHVDDPEFRDKKRTVMLMFGSAHESNLAAAFANLGIKCTSELLDGGLEGHVKNALIAHIKPVSSLTSVAAALMKHNSGKIITEKYIQARQSKLAKNRKIVSDD